MGREKFCNTALDSVSTMVLLCCVRCRYVAEAEIEGGH